MIQDLLLQKQANQLLPSPITAAEWRYLDGKGIVGKFRAGKLGAAGFAAEVDQIRQATGALTAAAVPRKARTPKLQRLRALIVARIVADEAKKDPSVAKFRQNVLSDQLIRPGGVPQWVRRQGAKDGAPTVSVLVPLPSGITLKSRQNAGVIELTPSTKITVSTTTPVAGTWTDELAYRAGNRTRLVPVRSGGVLDELRQISEMLSARFGWRAAEATGFVLSGSVPSISMLSAQTEIWDIPALRRLILRIDPAMSPRQLMLNYRSQRTAALAAKSRSIGEKHLKLALFKATRPAGETCAQSAAVWNQRYPQWSYKQLSTNFCRDALRARRRILGI